jgi:predicted secreted protein
MAQAKTLSFSGFVVTIGDGATPTELFAAPCGFTERSLKLEKAMGTTIVPDCADEAAASWEENEPISKKAMISGTGVFDEDAHDDIWRLKWASDLPFNAKIAMVRNGTVLGRYSGQFHLTSLEFGGSRGEKVTCGAELVSTGAVVWTAGP